MSEAQTGGPPPPQEEVLTAEQLALVGVITQDLTMIVPGGEKGYAEFSTECVKRFGTELVERLEQEKQRRKKKLSDSQRKESVRNFLVEKYKAGEMEDLIDAETYSLGLEAAAENSGPLWADPTEEDIAEHEKTHNRLALRITVAAQVAKEIGIFNPEYTKGGHGVYYWVGSNLGSGQWDMPLGEPETGSEVVPGPAIIENDEDRRVERLEVIGDFATGGLEDYLDTLYEKCEGDLSKIAGDFLTTEAILGSFPGKYGFSTWSELSPEEKTAIVSMMETAEKIERDNYSVKCHKDPEGKPYLELLPKTS